MPSLHSQSNRVVLLLILFSVCAILFISTLTSNGAFNTSYAKPSDRRTSGGSSRDGDDRSSRSSNSNQRNETDNQSPPTRPPLVPVPPENSGTGTLNVRKTISNQGGGNNRPSDFTINVDGNNPSPRSFPGSSSGTTVELSRGRYSVSETGPSGYTSNPSSGCSGSINPGQERTCTINNVFNKPVPPPITTGKITVTKRVDNTGGGNNRPSDFTINVDGNNPSPRSFPGSSAGSTVTIQPGRYQISETGPVSSNYVPGRYTPSYSADCSGNIRAGETNNCTIVNKYNPVIPGILSKLVVTKKVINDGGGTKKPSDFTITVHGNNPSPSSFYGRSSGTNVELRPGRYTVTETGPTSRYSTDYSRDCSGNATPNSVRKCNITNVYQEPGPTSKLIVIKNVDNNNQGSLNKRPSDFTITVHGNNPSPRSFAGKSDSGVSVSIYPGSYSVTEKTQSGYTVDYSNDCNGNIKSGQTKVCIINNEGISQSLPIVVTRPIITNISGFFSPYGVTTDTSNGNVYVTNFGKFNTTGTVSVINSSTNTIVRSLAVGNNPQAIEYNSANGFVYAANLLSDTLSVINGTMNQVVNTIAVGKSPGNSPSGIAVNSINNTIYAVNTGANTISVINGTNNQVKGYLKGFFNPSAVTFDPDNDAIYITNKGTNSISIMNATNYSPIKTLSSGGIMPSALVYNSANGLVYVSNTGSNTVSVFNTTTNTIVGTVPVGSAPVGIAYNQENGRVYVANSVSGTISVINGSSNSVTNTIPVGKTPIGISFNPINNSIYVANSDSNTITMIKEFGP
ncbi:MAG TPA: beta-propeller fold lactonase family protein [Nitrososphaeraceae archaeon]